MKALALAVLASSVALYAQAPTPPPQPHPGGGHPPSTTPPPPATPPPAASIPIEPKHSEATANLELAEQKKMNLQMQQQFIVANANTQLGKIRSELDAQDKAAAEAQEVVRKENGWNSEYIYQPPQQLPDGTTAPGKWQKTQAPPKK
jgi:hypothetical protein